MEFHIALTSGAPDTAVVQDALFDVDPGSVVDLDMSGTVMRISASAMTDELVTVCTYALIVGNGKPWEPQRAFQRLFPGTITVDNQLFTEVSPSRSILEARLARRCPRAYLSVSLHRTKAAQAHPSGT